MNFRKISKSIALSSTIISTSMITTACNSLLPLEEYIVNRDLGFLPNLDYNTIWNRIFQLNPKLNNDNFQIGININSFGGKIYGVKVYKGEVWVNFYSIIGYGTKDNNEAFLTFKNKNDIRRIEVPILVNEEIENQKFEIWSENEEIFKVKNYIDINKHCYIFEISINKDAEILPINQYEIQIHWLESALINIKAQFLFL